MSQGPPYICPLCCGNGQTPNQYSTAGWEVCRACSGVGIVWPPETVTTFYPRVESDGPGYISPPTL